MLPLMQIVKVFRAEKEHEDNRGEIWGLLLASSNNKEGGHRRTWLFYYRNGDAWYQNPLYRFGKARDVSGAADAESGRAEVLSEQEYPVERHIITLI